MKKKIFLVLSLSALVAVVSLFLITARHKVDYAALADENYDDRLKRAGLRLLETNALMKISELDFKEVTLPKKLFVVDDAILIYDNSSCQVLAYRLSDRTLISTFFRKGFGAGEITSGNLSLSPTKQELIFSDIQQARITILSIGNSAIKTIPVKFLPESANIINHRLFVRSFYLDSLVAEITENGDIVRQLPFRVSPLPAVLNLGAQGEITVDEDRVMLWFNYATPIYEYSVKNDSIFRKIDTPIPIPIPKPEIQKSGNQTVYSASEKYTVTNLDIRVSKDYIFALYSGRIPGETRSFSELTLLENSNIINIFSRKNGKYLCSTKLPVFARSIEVRGDTLYALSNINDRELTKVFVFKINVNAIDSVRYAN